MQDKVNRIYNIDNIEFLKTLGDKSISSCISDVPYALCDIDALAMIKEGIDNKGDFLGKKWFLPSVPFLKECHRVLKDGAFFITTFSPRQDLQCVFSYRLLEAGFDINFTPLLYAFASGFPKAADFSKMAQRRSGIEPEVVGEKLTQSTLTKRQVDGKRNQNIGFDSGGGTHIMQITKPTTPEAQYLDGLKSCQLKPVYEVVIIAQKPYKAKSKIDQALIWYNERKEFLDKGIKEEDLYLYTKNASGGVRIDKNDMFDGAMSSRIPCGTEHFRGEVTRNIESTSNWKGKCGLLKNYVATDSPEGRFPATILVENNCLDVGRDRKGGGACNNVKAKIFGKKLNNYHSSNVFDGGDLSRYFSLDAWTKKNLPALYKISKKTLELQEDAEKISPFLFTSKADKGSKNAGLDGFEVDKVDNRSDIAKGSWTEKGIAAQQNTNPCAKSLALYRIAAQQNTNPCAKSLALYSYLINLFTFPNDLVLDPYCGSGTTPIACVLTNRHYIGLELEKEYFDIAEARVKFWKEQIQQYNDYNNQKPSVEQDDLFG